MTSFPIKRVADIAFSGVDKKSSDGERPVRLCNYIDVYNHECITSDLSFMQATASDDQIRRFSLKSGDVLATKDSETADDIAVSAFVAEDMADVVCGYHLARLRPRSGIEGRFLFWALVSQLGRAQFSALANGITRFGLRYEAFGTVRLPFPPLVDQRAISEYLDRETARIDALITARGTMVALLRELWQGVIDRVIWDDAPGVVPLKHLVDPQRPVMYGIVLPGPDVGNGGVAIVKGGDVAAGRLTWDALCKTTKEIEAPFARARLRARDLVIAIRGGIGDVAIVPETAAGANITQDVARIAPRVGVDPTWLHIALQTSPVRDDIGRRVTGATVRGLNIWELDRLSLPVATAASQAQQLETLVPERQRIRRVSGALARQVALLRERRQALITAAVTGELGIPEGTA